MDTRSSGAVAIAAVGVVRLGLDAAVTTRADAATALQAVQRRATHVQTVLEALAAAADVAYLGGVL